MLFYGRSFSLADNVIIKLYNIDSTYRYKTVSDILPKLRANDSFL